VALLGQFHLLDLVERLDAALHLRGLGSVGPEAIDETLLLGEHGLLARESGLQVSFADGALALVEIVVARIADDFARVNFGDLGHDAVHELAVVRSHQQRARKGLEKLLQPNDGFNVQVIGRLIHQQHVRAAEQNARQRHAHLPATGQRAHVAVNLVVFKAQAMQHLARLGLQRVPIQVLVFFLHLAEAFQNAIHFVRPFGVFHGALQRFQLMMQIAGPSAARDGFIQNRAPLHLLYILAKIADVKALGNGDRPFVRFLLVHDHAKEGGLAGAIGPHQADLLAGIQLKRSVDKNQLLAVLFIDIGKRDHA
jgi:hypothetical protein